MEIAIAPLVLFCFACDNAELGKARLLLIDRVADDLNGKATLIISKFSLYDYLTMISHSM